MLKKFQLLSCFVNLAGERGNVVHRGVDNPVTYAEALLLRAVHGGEEHVHTLIDVGSKEASVQDEILRLEEKYGRELVKTAFPAVAGQESLPLVDETAPTAEEVKAAKEASEEALAVAKASRGKKKAPAKTKPADEPTDAAAVPSLDDLPK